jgi:ribosomal protein S18 acetylase RimI-like enzyme
LNPPVTDRNEKMASNRSIRPTREDDLESLIELGRRSWLSAFSQTAPFALIAWWVNADRVASLYREHWAEMLVLEEDGAIIGLVQPNGDEINGLWVHPGWQGSGAGTILLKTGEEAIRQAGYRTAWLTCSGFNTKALGFYQRQGYVETGRARELHASGVEVENVRMERPLDRDGA